jgi:hypothetical protein
MNPARDTSCVLMRNSASFTRWLLLFGLAFLTAISPAHAATKLDLPKKAPGEKFFTEPTPRTFNFEISEVALDQLRRSPRTYVPATLRVDDRVLTNVAVRLKGMGSFRTIDEKPSLAVKFDEFVPDQQYRGLDKIMLNNSVQDRTYLAEMLATQMFRDAGVPAARSTHARVLLNGRDLGLYVAFEAMNKDFLKQHFANAQGNLYETYVADINVRLDQDSGEDTTQADVQALLRACRIADPAARWPELNRVLNTDQFASFAAMELLTSHWDGYVIHTNNYRLYHDPATERFHFITHGIDWAFRRPNIYVYQPPKGLVARAVLGTPEGQRLYRERVGTLFTNVFRVPVIQNRLELALAKIRRAGLNANLMTDIERRSVWLRNQINLRALRVEEQLRGIEPEALKFDAQGFARLPEWRDEPDRGEPTMDRVKFDGRNTLHIAARNERTRASWRAQTYLKPGLYRFEGFARTDGLTGGSVRLRISGDTRSVGMAGNSTAWRPLAHDFEITEAGTDAEFVCELNAVQGEVWFDLDSLRVRKR